MAKDIVAQDMTAGEKLPHEPELLKHYAVSRASIREAIRLLEVQGLITVRPGPGPGTEVGRVDSANLARTLGLYLLMARISLDELLGAWLTVEPLLAQMAAENEDRERVRNCMAPFVSSGEVVQRNLDHGLAFHDVVAELAGNRVLRLIFGAIGFLVTEQIRAAVPLLRLSDETVNDHKLVAERILEGDRDGAYSAMQAHIEKVVQEVREVMPEPGRASLTFP